MIKKDNIFSQILEGRGPSMKPLTDNDQYKVSALAEANDLMLKAAAAIVEVGSTTLSHDEILKLTDVLMALRTEFAMRARQITDDPKRRIPRRLR